MESKMNASPSVILAPFLGGRLAGAGRRGLADLARRVPALGLLLILPRRGDRTVILHCRFLPLRGFFILV